MIRTVSLRKMDTALAQNQNTSISLGPHFSEFIATIAASLSRPGAVWASAGAAAPVRPKAANARPRSRREGVASGMERSFCELNH
jgi:hypothetical protein